MRFPKTRLTGAALARAFPEKRLFLKSDTGTRFVRLSPLVQVAGLSGGALVVGWTILASAVVLMDGVGSGGIRDQAERSQALYETRLNTLSEERDRAIAAADAAQDRFAAALVQVSQMQSDLMDAETEIEELEQGMALARDRMRTAVLARDDARTQLAAAATGDPDILDRRLAEAQATLDAMVAQLDATSDQRDAFAEETETANAHADKMLHEARLKELQTGRIFAQLEEALAVSVEPLDKMFRQAGLDTQRLIEGVRRGYSGQGGPLTPITFSTMGEFDEESRRANAILTRLDEMNLYRLAVEKSPFGQPVEGAFRYTSGFGPRWGRMHQGTDMAGPTGTPIVATADGVVIHAGRQGAYGNLIKIRHEFGTETRYAHLSRIRVSVGQRVSRGERIGDMGNTGRSTGPHLHYEVRVGGKPVNPMTYIKAARDVF